MNNLTESELQQYFMIQSSIFTTLPISEFERVYILQQIEIQMINNYITFHSQEDTNSKDVYQFYAEQSIILNPILYNHFTNLKNTYDKK